MPKKQESEDGAGKNPEAWTKPRQFRFNARTLAVIDWLGEQLGGLNRSDTIRVAVTDLAERKGYSAPPTTEGGAS